MEIVKMPENAKFYCEVCDFICCKKSNYEIHCQTKKHRYRVSGNEMENAEITKNAIYECKCGKDFKTNAGLWKHKQKCNSQPTNTIITKQDEPSDKEVMCMLIKQNSELIKEHSDIKEMILEIIKNGLSL